MVNKKEHCQTIAAVKRNETVDKVIKILVELIEQEQPISLKVVKEKSGVSQSWLYKNPDIKRLIECLNEYSPKQSRYFKEINKQLNNIEDMIRLQSNSNQL